MSLLLLLGGAGMGLLAVLILVALVLIIPAGTLILTAIFTALFWWGFYRLAIRPWLTLEDAPDAPVLRAEEAPRLSEPEPEPEQPNAMEYPDWI